MGIIRDVLYGLIAFTFTVVSFAIATPILYTMLNVFNDDVTMPSSNAVNFWSNAYDAIYYGQIMFAIVAVIAIIIWIYLRSRRKDYYVEGVVYS